MKVIIKQSPRWFGPYQIADALFFWVDTTDESKEDRWDYILHSKVGDILAGSRLNDALEWLYVKRTPKPSIEIHNFDVWNAKQSISYIVVPILKKLKEQKSGFAHVSDEDVPESFRYSFKIKDTEYGLAKWDWVLDEIIWAHEQIINPEGENLFYKNLDKVELNFQEVDSSLVSMSLSEDLIVDEQGLSAHHARIENGLRLFGKYYADLWD